MRTRKLVKPFCLALALATMLTTGLTGCGSKATTEDTTAASTASTAAVSTAVATETGAAKIDTSKEVELTGYLLGDRLQGMDAVMEKLNEKLKKDINATMKINYIGWGDLQSKYPLVLAAGENIDWIFTANWAYYGQEAAKGAFKEINQDMLSTYMPKHYALVKDTTAFKETLINGKSYMVTSATPDKKVNEFAIREDLRKKYNVPEVTGWTNIEPYLAAIKKNEPGMIPLNIDSAIDIGRPFFYQLASTKKSYYDLLAATSGGSGVITDTDDATGTLYKMTDPTIVGDYKATASVIKDWYDKGYINRNAYSNKVRSKDSFEQGKSAVAFGNTTDMSSTIDKAKTMGWEIKVMPGLSTKGTYPQDSYVNNGFAIAAKSQNPERVLMAMDLIMEDPAYDQLAYYGVDGVNYVEKDGKIALPDGVAADKNTYAPDASGFWFTNKDLLKPQAAWSEAYIQLREDAKKQVAPYVYAAFSVDTNKVKTEVANLNQVIVQYFNPINLGMIKDVDAAFKTLDDKLTAAGVDKLLAEMKTQTDAYKASQK